MLQAHLGVDTAFPGARERTLEVRDRHVRLRPVAAASKRATRPAPGARDHFVLAFP